MERIVCPVMVGRAPELAGLVRGARAAALGHGSCVGVAGDAGVGKSRLVRALVDEAAGAGALVAVGRAVAGGQLVPYRPMGEALMALTRTIDPANRSDLATFSPVLGRVAPGWLPAAGEPEPQAELSCLLVGETILRISRLLGHRRGLLLVMEDLHWADPDTLGVLEYLADNASGHPLALVVTYRPGEHGDLDVLAGALRSRSAMTEVQLQPLDGAEVLAMAGACLGGEVPDHLVAFLEQRSDGVPLFVEDLLAGLSSAGALRQGAGGWEVQSRLTPAVPLTFSATVTQRVGALRHDSRQVVSSAAVLGRRFDWRLLRHMTGLGEGRLLAALQEAVGAQLFDTHTDGFQFRHALTRDAVLGGLLPPRRESLSRVAVEALEAEHPGLPGEWRQLAAELAEAGHDNGRACSLLLESGRESTWRGALATAEATLSRARALAGDVEQRGAVDEALLEVLALMGRSDEAAVVGAEALAERPDGPDGPRRARLLLLLARAAVAGGEWARAAGHVDAARALHDRSPDAGLLARIDALHAHVELNQGRLDEAAVMGRAALAGATADGLPEVACEALEVLGRVERFRHPDESSRWFAQAGQLAEAHGLGAWRLRAAHELAVNEAFHGGNTSLLTATRAQAESAGAYLTVAVLDLHLAGMVLLDGRREEGLVVAARCVEACHRYARAMLPIALVHVGAAHALYGRADRAEEAVQEALRAGPGDPNIEGAAWGWVRGNLAFVSDDWDLWLSHLDRAADALRVAESTVPFPFRAVWALVRTVLDAGGEEARHELRSTHLFAVRANRAVLELGEAVELGREGKAGLAASAASGAFSTLKDVSPGLTSNTCLLLAAHAGAADGWGHPERWAREAAGYFSASGYDAVASRCLSVLRDLGVAVPRRGRGDSTVPPRLASLGVTSREMDVLRLVAGRLSNREIAGRLHLSHRTVEKHVASLLTRTGAANRRELGRLAGD